MGNRNRFIGFMRRLLRAVFGGRRFSFSIVSFSNSLCAAKWEEVGSGCRGRSGRGETQRPGVVVGTVVRPAPRVGCRFRFFWKSAPNRRGGFRGVFFGAELAAAKPGYQTTSLIGSEACVRAR